MAENIEFSSDRGDGLIYVTVAEMVAALLTMPQDAKVLISMVVVGDYRNDTETSIPEGVALAKRDDYYLGDDLVVEIRS